MTIVDHLPILVVLVPLFVAPLLAILPARDNTPWFVAALTSLLTFVVAVFF
jgi:hypothetical protein